MDDFGPTIRDQGKRGRQRPKTAQLLGISPGAPTVTLDGERVAIGRLPGNDVHLPSDRVSRRHAVVDRDGDRWLVQDLGSANGTTVNGKALEPRAPLQLQNQDVVTVADDRFLFVDWRVQLPDAPLADFQLDSAAVTDEVDRLLQEFRLKPPGGADGEAV
ncbi:MAG: FHA domain-containing protein [Planctomycetota bacterium]